MFEGVRDNNMFQERNCLFGFKNIGAGVAQRLSNGLPRNDPEFDSWWGRRKNQASRPSQGTVNVGAISK